MLNLNLTQLIDNAKCYETVRFIDPADTVADDFSHGGGGTAFGEQPEGLVMGPFNTATVITPNTLPKYSTHCRNIDQLASVIDLAR
jgi:hypothetical protein